MENHLTVCLDLGTLTGRSQALGTIANQCAAIQARSLEAVWETSAYKVLGVTWEQYCQDHVGLSRQRVEGIIRNLKEFGAVYLQLNEIITVSPETYRRLLPKIQEERLEVDGEWLPITPENAPRIRQAVNRLRADLRKAQDGSRSAAIATPNPLPALQARLDACFEEIRRLVPDDSLRALVAYSLSRLQELAEIQNRQ